MQTKPQRKQTTEFSLAIVDILKSFQLWKLAISLGWFDIKLRYKGSYFGPFWITLTSAAMIAAMGLIYSSLFKMDLHFYLPYISLMLILWENMIAIYLTDGCFSFIIAENIVHSVKLPFFVQILRMMTKNFITFALNLIIPLVVLIYYNIWPNWISLLSIPAVILNIINGWSISLFLGCICARYRDIPQVVNSIIQILFYVTPIIWIPSQLHQYSQWLIYNPFFPLLEIMRAPMMGQVPSTGIWFAAIVYSLFFFIISFFTFVKKRCRLAFWI